jgi:hypothetical protein
VARKPNSQFNEIRGRLMVEERKKGRRKPVVRYIDVKIGSTDNLGNGDWREMLEKVFSSKVGEHLAHHPRKGIDKK